MNKVIHGRYSSGEKADRGDKNYALVDLGLLSSDVTQINLGDGFISAHKFFSYCARSQTAFRPFAGLASLLVKLFLSLA